MEVHTIAECFSQLSHYLGRILSKYAPAVFSTNVYILNNKIDYIKYNYNCQLVKNYLTVTDEGSTFTPGPIVEVTVTFFI
jgi:hypothetical protein